MCVCVPQGGKGEREDDTCMRSPTPDLISWDEVVP